MQVITEVASYSQNTEQQVILAAVGDRVGKFLDIGSYDGKWCSNTLALIERGWSGVLIEPALEPFKNLLVNHGGNPKLTLIQAAVGPTRGLVEFWNAPSGVATTDPKNVKKWGKQLPFDSPYFIPQLSVADLLDKFPGHYDVVSIDTEGTSVAVFWASVRAMQSDMPQVWCVEHDGQEQACVNAVGAGYEVVERNGENIVLARREMSSYDHQYAK